jgi:hypothetical protein
MILKNRSLKKNRNNGVKTNLKKQRTKKGGNSSTINKSIANTIKKLKTNGDKITLRNISTSLINEKILKQTEIDNMDFKTIVKNAINDIKLNNPSNESNSVVVHNNKMLDPDYWVLPNRKKFINWIDHTFLQYKNNNKNNNANTSDLYLHQKFIRDYMQFTSAMRGVLLFHGLGRGKSCGSIAITEACKEHVKKRSIVVLLPASLEANYIGELMKCGDKAYKTQQYWEKIPYSMNNDIPASIIKKNGGYWLIVPNKGSNYEKLSETHKNEIKLQLKAIINTEYHFIHYNGLRGSMLDEWEKHENPSFFSNKVIVVDEVHNLISMMVGSGNIGKRLYKMLMNTENTKFVFLSGTPMINYPHEAGLLFNLLRGYITTYKIKLVPRSRNFVSENQIQNDLRSLSYIDMITVEQNGIALITKNEQYFESVVNKEGHYMGVKRTTKNVNNHNFIGTLTKDLAKMGYVLQNITTDKYTCFPEKQEEFNELFLAHGSIKNENLFKRRILGTVSYYNGEDSDLLPSKIGPTIVKCIMSKHQTQIYKQVRSSERDKERISIMKSKGKPKEGEKVSSYYRVFSRACCNFVFPEKIERPFPVGNNNAITEEDEADVDENNFVDDDYLKAKKKRNQQYEKDKQQAFDDLEANMDKYLVQSKLPEYSDKFNKLVKNLEKSKGSAFIYSQFRALEGIGILSLVLKANGYAQYKIKYDHDLNEWIEDIAEEDQDKPKYAFYSGTEEPEYKHMIKSVFNNELHLLSPSLRRSMQKHGNNLYGNVIKVLLATSSAAEGITLANVRQVHVIEPYWNPVRIEQVIGRAIRFKSHSLLPKEEQNVEVFIYISEFDKEVIKNDNAWMRIDKHLTSDEKVYEIASKKKKIIDGFFKMMKEASIDCNLNSEKNDVVDCFTFGDNVSNNEHAFIPNIHYDNRNVKQSKTQIEEKHVSYREFSHKGKLYYLNLDNMNVYDHDSVNKEQKGRKIKVGEFKDKKLVFI